MRYLKAYKEIVTVGSENKTYNKLTAHVKLNVSIHNTTFLMKFTYNHSIFVVLCYKPNDGDWRTAAQAWGYDNAIYIPIIARQSGANYYIPEIGAIVAQMTSSILISNAIVGNENQFTLYGYTHTEAWTAFTDVSVNATYAGATAGTQVVAVPTETITYSEGVMLELDEKTTIAINYQGFDITKPSEPKVKVSNSISLPYSPNNEKLTKSVELLQNEGGEIYDRWVVDYYLDNEQVLTKAKISVESIDIDMDGESRINCILYEKSTAFENIRKITWPKFMEQYYTWLRAQATYQWSGVFGYENMLTALCTSTEHIYLPFFYGDFFLNGALPDTTFYEYAEGRQNRIFMHQGGISGAHIATYAKSLFEAIKDLYGLDLMAATTNSLFDRAIEGKIYIQNRYLRHAISGTAAAPVHTITYNNGYYPSMAQALQDKSQKTVYDFVMLFVKQTNGVIDMKGNNEYELHSFEDIDTTVVDFSGGISTKYQFKPTFNGLAQRNKIDFAKYSDELPEGVLARIIECKNLNIDTEKDMFKVEGLVPPAYMYSLYQILGLFEKKTYQEFTLLSDSGNTTPIIIIANTLDEVYEYGQTMKIATIYGLWNSYNKYADIIEYPKMFTIEKWLEPREVHSMKFFRLYFIQELGGSFYINRINGYNAENSKDPTEIELVYVNNKLPN